MLPFGEEVLANFRAPKGPALVVHALDRGILEQLRVKPNKLERDRTNGTKAR